MISGQGAVAAGRMPLHVEQVQATLRDRLIGALMRREGRQWRLVALEPGQAEMLEPERQQSWSGPSVTWLPWPDGARLRMGAGTAGTVLSLGDPLVATAIGHHAEAAALRDFADRPAHLALNERDDLRAALGASIAAIRTEATAPDRPGAETLIEAQLRVTLVHLWRALARPGEQPEGARPVLLRFRQLLEMHFRDRWPVARYAAALNVSPDRLHDICTSALGRPPKRLIHERVGFEAQALLERAPLSLGQIADHLGFASAAQFNSYFRTLYGMPPGAWRRAARARRADGHSAASRSYADWP